jgi:DNA-binding LacI/PurR family transcriptional regulator
MLSLDHDASRFGMSSVVHDNFRGASLAVGHLVSKGHRRILAVESGDYRRQGDNQFIDTVSTDRISGYRLAMLERGLEPEIARLPSSWLPEFEKDLSAILKRRGFTAVFCPNNYVLKRVAEGIKIPQDLSLVGFHHHQEYIGSRKVSYVKADMKEMSARGAAYAKMMLEGKRPAFEPDVIDMELVKGETVVDMKKKRRAT